MASSTSGNCQACGVISAAVTYWSNPDGIIDTSERPLGSWQGYLDRKYCTVCQNVVEYLSNTNGGAEVRSPQCSMAFTLEEGRFRIGGTPFCASDAYPGHQCHAPHRFLGLVPSHARRFFREGEYFVRADPEWIDVGRIKKWLSFCETQHDDDCCPIIDPTLPGPARMVDVEKNCLVSTTNWPRYLALSYVWGKMLPGLATLKANFAALHTPGALNFGPNQSQLAATVRDAMALARSIGFTYLWADRLCIIQDDDNDKASQIKLMSDIYSKASLTIIAMDGDHADYGIRGLKGYSSPRTHVQQFYNISPETQLLRVSGVNREQVHNHRTWHTRAWTFQERLLSRRKLCFFEGSIFWECGDGYWTEDIASEADDSTLEIGWSLTSATTGVLDEHEFPDLQQYCDFVEEYVKRKIGFDADSLDACVAVLFKLLPFFPGGFHFGIPDFYFDIALLWTPTKQCQRRHEFPSWSWLGWKNGAITFKPFANDYAPLGGSGSFYPIDNLAVYQEVEWHRVTKVSPGKAATKEKVANACHKWREMACWADIPGWEINNLKTGLAFGSKSLVHKAFAFRYPVPTGRQDHDPHDPMCTRHCEPALCFTTRRAYLRIGSVAAKAFENHDVFFVNVLDEKGNWAGVMSSDVHISANHIPGERCEVICISSAKAQGKSLDSAYLEVRSAPELRGIGVYEFYNVLSIDWRNGNAQRKAVGRIWKPIWDGLGKEVVDITLE